MAPLCEEDVGDDMAANSTIDVVSKLSTLCTPVIIDHTFFVLSLDLLKTISSVRYSPTETTHPLFFQQPTCCPAEVGPIQQINLYSSLT